MYKDIRFRAAVLEFLRVSGWLKRVGIWGFHMKMRVKATLNPWFVVLLGLRGPNGGWEFSRLNQVFWR